MDVLDDLVVKGDVLWVEFVPNGGMKGLIDCLLHFDVVDGDQLSGLKKRCLDGRRQVRSWVYVVLLVLQWNPLVPNQNKRGTYPRSWLPLGCAKSDKLDLLRLCNDCPIVSV